MTATHIYGQENSDATEPLSLPIPAAPQKQEALETSSTAKEKILLAELEQTIRSTRKAVPNVDFFISGSFGFSGKNTSYQRSLREELATMTPQESLAPAGETYEAITDSSILPFFASFDFHVYYKFLGGGFSYHRLHYLSGTQFAGINIDNSNDPESLSEGSFANTAHAYAYRYSLIGNGYSLEFHLRRNFITDKVKLLYGIGYLYYAATFQYDVISVDENDRQVSSYEQALNSHGFIMRFEMSFLMKRFLIRTGLLFQNVSFPTQYIEGVAITTQPYILLPYISLGIGF